MKPTERRVSELNCNIELVQCLGNELQMLDVVKLEIVSRADPVVPIVGIINPVLLFAGEDGGAAIQMNTNRWTSTDLDSNFHLLGSD